MQNNLRDTLFRDPLMKAAGLQYVWPLDAPSNCVQQSYSPPWACVPSAHMQPVNGPTQTTGLVSANATQFASASSQYLSMPSNTFLQITGSFWCSAWIYLTSTTGQRNIITKDSIATREYAVATSGNDLFFIVFTSVATYCSPTSTGVISTNTWIFLFGYYDPASRIVGVRANNGAWATATITAGQTPVASTVPIQFGGRPSNSDAYVDGKISNVCTGHPQPNFRDWDALSRTLYANGAGLDLVRRMPLPNPPGRPIPGIEPILWCEADYGTYQTSGGSAATADGDPVGYWTDRSVFGNHPVQATSTKRPTLKLNILSGYPVLRFDGTDDFMSVSYAGNLNQPVTYFVVAKVSSLAANTVIFDSLIQPHRNYLAAYTDGQFKMYAGGSVESGGATNTNWNIHCAQFNNTNSFLRINGVQSSNLSPGSDYSSMLKLGLSESNGDPFVGDIAAVFVYPGALTAAQIASVESYLNTKYAVY